MHARSPGGSVRTRVRARALADGPTLAIVHGVVLEPEGGLAAAPGPEEQQLPPVALLERHYPLPEPLDDLVARAEVPILFIHVPVCVCVRGEGLTNRCSNDAPKDVQKP